MTEDIKILNKDFCVRNICLGDIVPDLFRSSSTSDLYLDNFTASQLANDIEGCVAETLCASGW